ncbi:hypothetical protein SDC9_195543 [bioreactor metagenome]|uniref:Uncharacterized protein n=1 Tax=bioreactor metagenome TaxID=1076179 RepID=A0A645IBU8_9ZZZZ
MPRISEITATSPSMTIRLPPERISTSSVIARPTPVSVTVPTMMPAVAVAMPMPIMLRAPVTRPSNRSWKPCRAAAANCPWPRKKANSGRWVTRMNIRNSVAQKAERAGESCSTIRFQTSAATGSRKCRPDFSVGPISGRNSIFSSGRSMCSSG